MDQDGTALSYMYRIGTQDWQPCDKPKFSSIVLDPVGHWRVLEDITEDVNEVFDSDGTLWSRKSPGWWCEEPIQYESKVYGPFTGKR